MPSWSDDADQFPACYDQSVQQVVCPEFEEGIVDGVPMRLAYFEAFERAQHGAWRAFGKAVCQGRK